MSSDRVARLYECEEILERVSTLGEASLAQNESLFLEMIDAVGGDDKAKILAAQFIPRFCHLYPDLADRVVDSMIDLCEVENVVVRLYAIKGLPNLCKISEDMARKVTGVLLQLVSSDESRERQESLDSLAHVCRGFTKVCLSEVFSLSNSGDINVRDNAKEFLRSHIFPSFSSFLRGIPVKERFETVRNALQYSSEEEFSHVIEVLGSFRPSTKAEAKEISDLVSDRFNFGQDFDVTNTDQLKRFFTAVRNLRPYFVNGASSTSFSRFALQSILPRYHEIPSSFQKNFLQYLASTILSLQDSAVANEYLSSVYELLKSLCPLNVPGAKFNLSLIEAVLFSFYGLAKLASPRTIKQVVGYFVMSGQPSDMVGINEARLALEEFRKLFRSVLQQAQKYVTQMNTAKDTFLGQTTRTPQEAKERTENLRNTTVALRVLDRIVQISEALLLPHPNFEKPVKPSWLVKSGDSSQNKKRANAGDEGEGTPQKRQNVGSSSIGSTSARSRPRPRRGGPIQRRQTSAQRGENVRPQGDGDRRVQQRPISDSERPQRGRNALRRGGQQNAPRNGSERRPRSQSSGTNTRSNLPPSNPRNQGSQRGIRRGFSSSSTSNQEGAVPRRIPQRRNSNDTPSNRNISNARRGRGGRRRGGGDSMQARGDFSRDFSPRDRGNQNHRGSGSNFERRQPNRRGPSSVRGQGNRRGGRRDFN